MFARTERLLLRPGFPEDVPALAPAIAEALIAQGRDPLLPSLLILERTDQQPRIVGICGLRRRRSGSAELRCWIVPEHRGRGLATEACGALVDIARTLQLPIVHALYRFDEPASGRLLSKLGFKAGQIHTHPLAPRTGSGVSRVMQLDLLQEAEGEEQEPLAA
jgi:RimJ/RimL family protein N-acetyltransferase